ncbi:glutamate-1-semialdehyde 2,1-aminomutase [Rhizobium sp. BK251]|uniref:glutamate-1-semialdehyde 2,1-aminomutase n=1 Tax=Rhizobium sp. BK251 TaxID=2512125 RepID=UPI00104CEE57|nr:glutamate-1-semialdehyde 2,1-aminomutase [Rhizobium sp. BK251]TCL74559.1 glutamate-1-semialdehyde 2,1-aminomutase [Rhizobium sp. BK251]
MSAFIGNFEESNRLRERARDLIPGGAHTYAKGDDQYPILSPGFIARGQGCHVWDVDGNEYIEYGMGNRAVGLGHAYAPVLDAVRKELEYGCNFTRPASIEVECAETFLEMVRGADMVKFSKNGSDATSGAIKLARAVTGREMIARCSDHPFFSVDDWFIGTTEMNTGIPEAIRQLTLGFKYNDIESLRSLFRLHPGKIAAVILEATRGEHPKDRFLHKAMELCRSNGALFILDEMITGFRWHSGGAQELYNIEPDLSCFGKALGNGFSVSALAGKREFMERGGLEQTAHPRVFLLSTTHGAETHALAAAIATMRIYRDEPVIEHLYRQGEALQVGIGQAITRHGLQDHFYLTGQPCCLAFATLDRNLKPSQAFRTLFLQETIRRGILAPSLVVSYTHGDEDIERTVEAFDGALGVYKLALERGVGHYLVGRPSDLVFRRFNRPPLPADEVLVANNG